MILYWTDDKYGLCGFLVSDTNINLSEIDGCKVMQYSELDNKNIDVIIAVGRKNNSIDRSKVNNIWC